MTAHRLNGNHVLYHYLQKDLLGEDIWLFQMLASRLVVSLGIWMHPAVYQHYPLLRPFAVRDPEARRNPKRGIPEQWGSPDRQGLFRDDNSLIKAMPYSLTVSAPANSRYNGRRVEKGFVASHVWRMLPSGNFATRHRLTYSFVPNLVWLPAEVSKLTDRQGSFTQAYLQALAIHIYRDLPVAPPLRGLVDEAWELLPEPTAIPQEGLPSVEQLSFFNATRRFYDRNLRDLRQILTALPAAREGRAPAGRVISSRYGKGLPGIPATAAKRLQQQLAQYVEAVEAGL